MRRNTKKFQLSLLKVSLLVGLILSAFLCGCDSDSSDTPLHPSSEDSSSSGLQKPAASKDPVQTPMDTTQNNDSNTINQKEEKEQENRDVESTTTSIADNAVAESSSQDTKKSSRDNTPVCLIPKKDGITIAGNDAVYVDLSHTDQGYCMLQYLGNNPKVKLQITGPDGITYTYDLSSHCDAFPFTAESGNYQISVFENISGQQYAVAYNDSFNVSLQDEFLPYLYANQYVNFTENSLAIQMAEELAETAEDDLAVVSNVYNYIISNSSYDYDRAKTVKSGYLPDIDEFINRKSGICFDFASTMAAMLRSQGIPTRLEIGYAGEAYHAWISTYLDEKGWVNGIIEFDGKHWKLMDPTFATNSSEESLKKYIGDGSNYRTKYRY